MAIDPSEVPLYRDTIKVPAVMQLPGDPFPTEFYARYPEAFRVPVRIVWRERESPRTEPPSRPSAPDMTALREAADGAFAEAVPGAADHARASPAAPAVGSAYGRADPVATFLRINDALDRVAGKLAPAPAPGTPQVGPDGKPLDPYTPVPFFDDQGQPVLNPQHKQMMRPSGFDPHFFVERGLKDGESVRKILAEHSGPDGLTPLGYSMIEALLFQATQLYNFRQSGAWDAQRQNGINYNEFVDYATVAIGLYSAAAGIPQNFILTAQNLYRTYKDLKGDLEEWVGDPKGKLEHYKAGTEYDPIFGHLPENNVTNTDTGYKLYRSGAITPKLP